MAMELVGERMLFVTSAGSALLLAAFTAWRLALRERPPAEDRSGFAGVPITSPVIAGRGAGAPVLPNERIQPAG